VSSQSWVQVFSVAPVDGAAITAAAATSMLPAESKLIFASGQFQRATAMRIRATGRISCVVTTPGTARYDVRLAGNVVFDSQAINLNTTAKTNVGWWLEILMTLRATGSGTNANFMGQGIWQSEAVIGSPAVTAGGNGSVLLPYNAAPAVGGGFDMTAANAFDMQFTQTVTTGSMTLHQAVVEICN
jgi:hypothetical protein